MVLEPAKSSGLWSWGRPRPMVFGLGAGQDQWSLVLDLEPKIIVRGRSWAPGTQPLTPSRPTFWKEAISELCSHPLRSVRATSLPSAGIPMVLSVRSTFVSRPSSRLSVAPVCGSRLTELARSQEPASLVPLLILLFTETSLHYPSCSYKAKYETWAGSPGFE